MMKDVHIGGARQNCGIFFIETRSVVTETQRRFRNFYGIKTGSKPDYKTVVDIVNRFQSRGSIHATATRQRDPPIRTPANIIGPFWFEDASGASENVNQFNYQPVIQMFVAELKRRGLWTQRAWFQQDGATCHTTPATLEVIKEHFGQRVISLKTAHIWSPNSPDLTPLDFFLWGYAKDNVFQNNPKTIPELQKRSRNFIKAIPLSPCKKVVENISVRLGSCIAKKGRHIEHVIKLKNI